MKCSFRLGHINPSVISRGTSTFLSLLLLWMSAAASDVHRHGKTQKTAPTPSGRAVTALRPVRPDLVLQVGHTHAYDNPSVTWVSYSPDGTIVATIGVDPNGPGEIKLWRAATGSLLRTLPSRGGELKMCMFSPKGDVLASIGEERPDVLGRGDVTLWNPHTGAVLRRLHGPRVAADALAFSPDGRSLFTGGIGGTKLLQASTLKTLWSLEEETVLAAAFAHSGKLLATTELGNQVTLRNPHTGAVLRTLTPRTKDINERINAMALSPDDALIAVATEPGNLHLWEVGTGRLIRTWPGHKDGAQTVAFTPAGILVSGGFDGQLRFWKVARGGARQLDSSQGAIAVEGYGITAFALSPDAKRLVLSDGEDITAWNVASRRKEWTAPSGVLPMTGVAFDPAGKTLATHSWDETVRLWDMETGKLRQTLWQTGYSHGPIVFGPDGTTLASTLFEETLLWDVTTGKLLHKFPVGTHEPAAFSKDGSVLAIVSGAHPTKVEVRNIRDGQQIIGRKAVAPVVFLPNIQTLTNADWWKSGLAPMELWNAESGTFIQSTSAPETPQVAVPGVEYPRKASLLSGTGDGQTLACWAPVPFTLKADNDSDGDSVLHQGTVELWDAATGKVRRVLGGTRSSPVAVAFSPSGKLIAVASEGSPLEIWDVTTAKLQTKIKPYGDDTVERIAYFAFSADDTMVVCTSQDGTARAWATATGELQLTWMILPTTQRDTFSRDWIARTPNGFYDGSPGASKYIRWRVGNQLFPAASFAKQFYRPDVVRRVLSGTSQK